MEAEISISYFRDESSLAQLQLDDRLKDGCTMRNMEVGWEQIVVRARAEFKLSFSKDDNLCDLLPSSSTYKPKIVV